MTWSANTGTRVDGLITQIATNLVAGGWTLTDRAADQVWHSTNNHGVTQYIQITEGGASYQYLQFQGWRTWSTGTHSGTDGSGTTYQRAYYASAAVAAATLVDLYMSVTANRFILFIRGVGNYNSWAYFGGCDSLIGTDPMLAYLGTSYIAGGSASYIAGVILQSYSSGAYWSTVNGASISYVGCMDSSDSLRMFNSVVGSDSSRVMAFPMYISGVTAPYSIRGRLEGLLFIPSYGMGQVSQLDTLTISGVNYLVIQPGGSPTAHYHAFTGNYFHFLAIAEV